MIAYVKIILMLILASNSPRRKQLISLFNVPVRVIAADIDEGIESGEKPRGYVSRLAHSKSRSIVSHAENGQVVIGADTAVVDRDEILGKPSDPGEAFDMLITLRDRSHHVYTGISVWNTSTGSELSDVCVTEVRMRAYSEAEIYEYVASGDPLDKAGAYAIQNQGFNPVQSISGCYSNVVGLPLCHLSEILLSLGLDVPDDPTRSCRSANEYNCQLVDQIQEFKFG